MEQKSMFTPFMFVSSALLTITMASELFSFHNPLIAELDSEVSSHYLNHHDFLQCFEKGLFRNMTHAAAIFAENQFIYSRRFIDYLNTVVDKVENATVAEPILENIAEETGHYTAEDLLEMQTVGIMPEWFDALPHKLLFHRFLRSLNIDPASVDVDAPHNHAGQSFAQSMLDTYSKANPCEALSVIGFAIEETVSTLYQFIWEGLKEHTSLSPEQYVFFPLHIILDDGHADLLKLGFQFYLDSAPESCARAPQMIKQVLDRRSEMFDELRFRIESEQGYECPLPSRVTADTAVLDAQRETSSMAGTGTDWTMVQKMAISSRILADQGHGTTLSGQITCMDREATAIAGETLMWATAYGTPLDVVTEDDFVLVDKDLAVVRGSNNDSAANERFPSRAVRFHSHLYAVRPDIACIVHTHPPKTSALAMTGKPLHIAHMDTMAFYDDVQYLREWPGIPFGDEEGDIIANLLGETHWSALLAHHGLIVGGRTIEEATYRAFFFEKAAEMQLAAMAANGGDLSSLPVVDASLAIKAREWRISPGPVNAHWDAWQEIAFQRGHWDCVNDDRDFDHNEGMFCSM